MRWYQPLIQSFMRDIGGCLFGFLAASSPVFSLPPQDYHDNLSEKNLPPGPSTTQTWPFVEVYCNKRYFYLEAQSYIIDGHPELFLWLWFLG